MQLPLTIAGVSTQAGTFCQIEIPVVGLYTNTR